VILRSGDTVSVRNDDVLSGTVTAALAGRTDTTLVFD
jgi:hypothetical protein